MDSTEKCLTPLVNEVGSWLERLLARGWLIERARTKKLREELAAYKDFASHWEFCMVNSKEVGCDCDLAELRERFDARESK